MESSRTAMLSALMKTSRGSPLDQRLGRRPGGGGEVLRRDSSWSSSSCCTDWSLADDTKPNMASRSSALTSELRYSLMTAGERERERHFCIFSKCIARQSGVHKFTKDTVTTRRD